MSADPRSCTHHPQAPAIAVCAQCGADICGECHRPDLRGFARCTDCSGPATDPLVPWEEGESPPSVAGFFRTAAAALTSPRGFFAQFHFTRHWGFGAGFGMLCILVGTLVNTGWQKAFSAQYAENLRRYEQELGVSAQLVELFSFAATPFIAVLVYFVHTALLYLALKALAVDATGWSRVARITGYSLAAYLLLIFPPIGEFSLGHFLMVLWLFNLEVNAVRAVFGVGFWKSIGVVLLPMVVFLFALG